MKNLLVCALPAVLLLATACKKEEAKTEETPDTAPTKASAEETTPKQVPGEAGKRSVAIEVGKGGYQPASVSAAAAEEINLVFTRTADNTCGEFIIVPGIEGKTELPLNEAVTLAVTMPTEGDLIFTCGMKMMEGKVVVAAK